ncbi:MAG: APC family permease [Chloroflexi bacterium]|nr:APC family permease [Chloroflexota bacterium]MBU1746083.1 APC family permease [Chloroflexota bacterium]
MSRIKHWLIGSPLPTHQLAHARLNKVRALAAFSPDALSSIAYANQEIYLGLLVAGSAGLSLAWPIGLAIAGVLAIVALSYFQTVHGYPSGGGSYAVARENLGTLPGLVAGAALLVDYLLTAAVSLTAGVDAVVSAFPELWPHRVIVALLLLLIITLLNLRGVEETGSLMAVPVYLFLLTYFGMLAYGLVRAVTDGPGSLVAVAPPPAAPLTTFLVLHAFSSGCTALTGVEAISNGVPAFRPPEARNAGRTLIVMAVLMGLLFVGSIGLTQYLAVVAGPQETILSALARRLLGNGPAYLVIQFSTMLILAVAANTSFAGFPRLAAILAQDGFLPHQLTGLGDRLVFNNGILLLAGAAGLLIVLFGGDTHALIPLFAVGVFLAFTLSQAGMVVHWWREQGRHWPWKALVNGVGAVATAMTLLIVGVSKFMDGAWIIVLLIPVLVIGFLRVRVHYRRVAEQLSLSGPPPSVQPCPPPRVVVPISGVHRGIVEAVNLARAISQDVTAVYVELEPGAGQRIQAKWAQWWPDVPLVVVPSPYRSVVGPLLDYLDETDTQHADGQLAAVVLPEFVPAHWWESLFHNQTAWLLKAALLYRRRHLGFQRVIIDVPFHLRD